MFTRPASGLRCLSALSAPPRLFPSLRCRTTFTLRRPQSTLDVLPTSTFNGSSTCMPPSPHVYGLDRLPVPRGHPADKSGVNHLAGIVSPSDMQDHQQHGRVLPQRVIGHTKRQCPAHRRRTLIWLMLTAKAPTPAWAAYEELLSYRAPIPHHLLHKLARLLASIKPRTRTVHLQLLSVLKTLERNHGKVRLWEWNTLIDSAGKQWHATRLEDYENSLDIFNSRGILPAGTVTSMDKAVDSDAYSPQQKPDIWSYNILLSIASRTKLPQTIRHASSLLLASGLTPNRYTHLCLLRYFATRNDLSSVRSTLNKMNQQGLEVGLDGTNACLWAFARNGRFDVALRIYRVLRRNVKPTPDLGVYDVEEDARYIQDTLGLDIPDGLEPDEVTYTIMIQTLAYHGDLRNALGIYVDMLSTPNPQGAVRTHAMQAIPACYKPSMAAFRGLFLGFSRHGRDTVNHRPRAESLAGLFPSSRAAWDLETLETVFTAFLQLPSQPKPTGRIIYWILVAFDKTSGQDSAKLREVWTKLEAKYGSDWGGRLEGIRRSIFI